MSGYEVVHIDELESFPVDDEGLTWRPIRRRFDIRGFGVNAYTAEREGQRVVEEHRETNGHEELYVVIAGRATFTLDGEEHDAPAGTLVHCPTRHAAQRLRRGARNDRARASGRSPARSSSPPAGSGASLPSRC